MKEYLRLGLTLMILGIVSASILSIINSQTAPIIAEAAKEASYGAYYEIYENSEQDVDSFNEIDPQEFETIQASYPNVNEVLLAEDGSANTIGYVFTTTSNGYGGEMVNAIIIDTEGGIVGYRNLSNGETPGFGAMIDSEEYYSRFDGKSVEDADSLTSGTSADNEIEAISGSTVTTNAVLTGLNDAVGAFHEFFME